VPRSTGEFILRDVTVVDVADGSRSGGLDVRISGGTITETGAVSQHAAGITVVDGGGAFVVPGYVDSHVHALNDPGRVAGAYALMLANGITGFRQMSGSPKPGAGQQADRGQPTAGPRPAHQTRQPQQRGSRRRSTTAPAPRSSPPPQPTPSAAPASAATP
jgi:hypothetical protein